MVKIYSKGCEYALRILTQIPRDGFEQKFLAVDLSKKSKVPLASARKILQLLVAQGYLEAVSGPGGGYKLKKNPENVNLLEIIKTVDGEKAFDHCVMGLAQCGSANPCPAHNLWQRIKDDMKSEMKQTTLWQLMSAVRKGKPS